MLSEESLLYRGVKYMKSTDKIKMVIAMRVDLHMRKGKMCAQAGHAVQMSITKLGKIKDNKFIINFEQNPILTEWWFSKSYTKIVVGVRDEVHLNELYNKAITEGIPVVMVVDNGITEFHGEKTPTCIALGPDYSSKIDRLTGGLQLL